MTKEYLELGALAIVCIFLIKEVFNFLKTRKNSNLNGTDKQILEALRLQNENHLHTIQKGMNDGFNRMIDCYNDKSDKMIELLARIEGRLSK